MVVEPPLTPSSGGVVCSAITEVGVDGVAASVDPQPAIEAAASATAAIRNALLLGLCRRVRVLFIRRREP